MQTDRDEQAASTLDAFTSSLSAAQASLEKDVARLEVLKRKKADGIRVSHSMEIQLRTIQTRADDLDGRASHLRSAIDARRHRIDAVRGDRDRVQAARRARESATSELRRCSEELCGSVVESIIALERNTGDFLDKSDPVVLEQQLADKRAVLDAARGRLARFPRALRDKALSFATHRSNAAAGSRQNLATATDITHSADSDISSASVDELKKEMQALLEQEAVAKQSRAATLHSLSELRSKLQVEYDDAAQRLRLGCIDGGESGFDADLVDCGHDD